MAYSALLLDLFHTLVDAANAPAECGLFTADILGVDRGAWSDACFGPLHDICRPTDHAEVVRTLALSLDPTVPQARIDQAVLHRQRRFDHTLENVEPHVLELLRWARGRGIRTALVSNASTGEVAAWPRSPLAAQFDVTLFSCECGLKKPDPAIFHLALERLGVSAADALFVGDGGSDEHRGARAAGIDNVLITYHIEGIAPERLAARRAQVRYEIAHLGQLRDLLAGDRR